MVAPGPWRKATFQLTRSDLMMHELHVENIHINKMYPGLLSGEFSRVFLFFSGNWSKCLNNFRRYVIFIILT